MAKIERLTQASDSVRQDINVLIHQLSLRLPECSSELLESIIADPNLEVWVVTEDAHIVGMAALVIVTIPEGRRAQMEDIVIDEKYRGQGLGEQLSKKLIERARARDASVVTLSSRADRVAANTLYVKLGFESRETNVYRLEL